MTFTVMAVVAATIVVSSFLSGVFGMAGGMILLGVLLVYFDVPTSMLLFSIIQMASNGWRTFLWRRFVLWRIFFVYVVGAAVAFTIMRFIAFVPDKAMVYLSLGFLPYLIEILPRRARPNIEWRGVPFITGFLTTIVQLIAGVGGLFLDIFFQKSKLDRKTIVATKAVSQTFSHVVRVAYFGSLSGMSQEVPLWSYVPALLIAIAGTSLASLVLERMTDVGFRQWTRKIIFVVSTVYLFRAATLLWQG
jgi:uncharacterized protein